MFDTLVSGFSDDQEEDVKDSFEIFKGSKSLCDEVLRKTSYFGNEKKMEGEEKKDPILQYLQKYYMGGSGTEDIQLDSSTDVGDLSWDEGDLPSGRIKVWTFNDFMEQYNQIYAWLNTIQVQYHAAKKKDGSSPRVETLLKDLERDVERRERFLRECGRMVGAFPEIEEEVTWRVEHVMSKWDMLSNLRIKTRTEETDIPDIYSDIELEVRCLRKWLKEMEQRIDPLQFSKIAEWSTRDRERKMAEYQVLQTDIESHGRIVKLVLSLCEDLTLNPGLYDLQHAVKVAKGLERRWHHIWLRSLEWQCLLEQWIQDPLNGNHCSEDSVFDTDDEPLTKVPKLNTACGTPNFSPAATLLRRKKRKRWINSSLLAESLLGVEKLDPDKREKLISPRLKRIHDSDSERNFDEDEQIIITNMITSESDPSLTETAPSTSRSESSESVTFIFNNRQIECLVGNDEDGSESDIAPFNKCDKVDNIHPQMASTPISRKVINNHSSKAELMGLDSNNRVEEVKDGFWDTSDEDAFVDNSRNRKVTVLMNPSHIRNSLLSGKRKDSNMDESIDMEMLRGNYKKFPSDEMFSQDSLEVGSRKFIIEDDSRDAFDFYSGVRSIDDITSDEYSSVSSELKGKHFKSEENMNKMSAVKSDKCTEILNFGDDYRQFINSLSDSSVTDKIRNKSKKIKRRTRKREIREEFPYESQSDVELEEAFMLLTDSQKQIHSAEACVHEYFSQGFVKRENTKEYDDILEKCSVNVNILFNLLESVAKGDSFVSQKKCRDTRLLISRWENILQKVTDSVNNSKVYDELKDETKYLKEHIVGLNNSQVCTTNLEENDDLESRMQNIKKEMVKLTQQKAKLFQLNISVHNFLAELANSSLVDETQLNLAEELKEEVVDLYSLWDVCHHQTVGSLSQTEEAIKKLHEFEHELLDLRSALQTDSFLLKQRNRKKLTAQSLKNQGSSGDSGISDGSCGILSDYDLPEKHQRLSKLKLMATSLKETLSPKAPAFLMISKTLEATSNELNDLQKSYMSYKTNKKKKKAKLNLGLKNDKEKFRPKVSSAPRRRRYAKITMTIHLLLMIVLFLTWLCHPRCCDSFSAISFSPQLKYVNGPPPI